MSVFETVLLFVVPPVVVYLILAALVIGPSRARRPRYRAGQGWPYEPLFWTANPEGAQLPDPDGRVPAGQRGGARGDW